VDCIGWLTSSLHVLGRCSSVKSNTLAGYIVLVEERLDLSRFSPLNATLTLTGGELELELELGAVRAKQPPTAPR
jgi:hypothetical protein